ncbi:MAG: hypothetical protein QXX12_00575 [Nanopusillaceae archaeon]
MADRKVLKEIILPSGKKAVFYNGKGKDLFEAMLKGTKGEFLLWHLIAQLVEIEGEKFVLEDFYEMDLFDVLAIQATFGELFGSFLSSLEKISSPSQNTQGGQLAN